MPHLLVLSRGIQKIPHGPAFLPEYGSWTYARDAQFTAVAGWGHNATALPARKIARLKSVPYVALEDGFLRSIQLGRDGDPPLSLVVDPVGIYYDARQPSQLELWLEDGDCNEPFLLERARFARQWLVDERLSKYNFAPDRVAWPDSGGERVLVVDQSFGDASVAGALADQHSFTRMLQAALDENPDCEVLVRTHPDVLAGYRKGCLGTLPKHRRLRVQAEELHPWAALDGVSKVYTVSSLLGFEALLAGKAVRCFGLPFYAGWGLTADELSCPRRTRKVSLDELFAAAYLRYARYVDPVNAQRCEIERIIALLADRRRHWLKVNGPVVFCGASYWKRRFLPDYMAGNAGKVQFVRNPEKAIQKATNLGGRLAVWASAETPQLRDQAERLKTAMIRVEDAFLRSVGLGSDLIRPGSLILDDLGIYYDSSRPSRLEELLRDAKFCPGLLRRARELHQAILKHGLTKYNVGNDAIVDLGKVDRTVVLVPGQVEDDASILRGSPAVQKNKDLLQLVRTTHPDDFIVFKPHPDVVAGNRRGMVRPDEARQWCDLVLTDISMDRLLSVVDQVHTMTSLTGFEALLRGKQVVTYGMPFYAGWGLTADRLSHVRRGRTLSLEQLIAGALILYPTYVDPRSRQICSAEDSLLWLARNLGKPSEPPLRTRVIRFVQHLLQGRESQTK